MSYDLHAYSQSSEPVALADLESVLRRYGWEILFGTQWMHLTETPGPLTDGFIIGWDSNSADSARIRETILSGDEAAFDTLYMGLRAGLCEVYETQPLPPDDPEFDERFAGASPEQLDILRSAKAGYYLRTAAGRSLLSGNLQEAMWHAIGEITGGLMEDPQSGEFGRASDMPPPPGPEVVLPAESAAPRWAIGWYLVFTALALFSALRGANPIYARNWPVMIGLLHAPIAFGLWKRFRPARFIAIGLSSVLLALGIVGMFLLGTPTLHKLVVAAIYVQILIELFSPAVKAHFDD